MTQHPGNLPEGFGLDSMLTLDQAATWLQWKPATLKRKARTIPGISGVKHNRRMHPRTYLDAKGIKR